MPSRASMVAVVAVMSLSHLMKTTIPKLFWIASPNPKLFLLPSKGKFPYGESFMLCSGQSAALVIVSPS
jgi:hypothetical protein